jgi:hypothetical protein
MHFCVGFNVLGIQNRGKTQTNENFDDQNTAKHSYTRICKCHILISKPSIK